MVEGKEFRELMLQVVRTRMAFRRSMQRTLKKNNAGITFEMLQILSCLWHEQGITQQVLAERTAKDKACLTNLMNNLEKKGYVHRKEDPEDRRNKLVFLTPEGEEFKKQIRPILDQVYVHAEHIIIRKTKCFDFWERNVLFPKTKRSFFRTPKHPLPCPFPLNFSLLIITKKFGNLAKNRYICIV